MAHIYIYKYVHTIHTYIDNQRHVGTLPHPITVGNEALKGSSTLLKNEIVLVVPLASCEGEHSMPTYVYGYINTIQYT